MAAGIKMPVDMKIRLGPGDFVSDGEPLPLPQKGEELPPNGWMDQDSTWHVGRPQPRRLCVRWGPSRLPFPKKGAEPPTQFSVNFYCDQTAGHVKMPLGIEVGLIPGDFVFDGDSAPLPKKGGGSPQF